MIFDTRIQGIPCKCRVTYYAPSEPMVITGSGFGDCIAPYSGDIEYEILDRKGYKAAWLEKIMTPEDNERLWKDANSAMNTNRNFIGIE